MAPCGHATQRRPLRLGHSGSHAPAVHTHAARDTDAERCVVVRLSRASPTHEAQPTLPNEAAKWPRAQGSQMAAPGLGA